MPSGYRSWCSFVSLAGLLLLLSFTRSALALHTGEIDPDLPRAQQWVLQIPDDPLTLRLEGTLVSGGMLRGRVQPVQVIRIDDRALTLTESGEFAFGFGRDQSGPVRVSVLDAQGRERHHWTLDVAERNYDIQYIEGISRKMMQPDAATIQRVREENRRVAAARKARLSHEDWNGSFIWPLQGIITGVYGSQRFYNGEPRRPHFGIDIAAATGTPVLAPAGGTVTFAEPDLFYSGGTLILDHGMGLSSSFLHLSRIRVKPGDRVEQGEVIAEVGATGRVTGPHLDWRMNLDGVRIDPQLLMTGDLQ